MNDLSLEAKIEAILFARAESMGKTELSIFLDIPKELLEEALQKLRGACEGRGITLLDDGARVELRSSPGAASLLARLRKEELSRDIGKASLETLAIVLYKGQTTRSEIDFIRGVNSSHTLRTILIRGLVRKIINPRDERSFFYEPTTELLAHLGVTSLEGLPDRVSIRGELEELLVRPKGLAEDADVSHD